MRVCLRALLLCLSALFPAWVLASSFAPDEEMSDDEMAGVSAQQGVILDIYMRNNVTETFIPNCTAKVGTPNACRIALEFADRPGVYLMLKEFYGTLRFKEIRMDAFTFPVVNTAYVNNSRFQDSLGNCLIPGKANPNCNPASTPAIKFTYPATDDKAVYDDFSTLMNIGRVWLEFDTSYPAACTGACVFGYNRDTSLNSGFSLRLADSSGTTLVPDPLNPPDFKISNNTPAMMRFWGQAYVFGF